MQNEHPGAAAAKTVADPQVLCKLCGSQFMNSKALGGHLSKTHAGQSETYKYRQSIREQRQENRDFLNQTKEFYKGKYPDLF